MNSTEKEHRPRNVVLVPCTKESFFKVWVTFMRPWHRLAPREGDVFAIIMQQYFNLKPKCEGPTVLRTLLWSGGSRQEMRRMLGMSQPHFQMVLKKLREAGVLMGNEGEDINPRYLPKISEDSKTFELRVIFDYSTPSIRETPADETVTSR